MMGAGPGGGAAMMDEYMVRTMMWTDMMSGLRMDQPSTEGAREALPSRLAEFDADGDGSLSLAEFETLHTAMIRETTVDRLQHLDADGDGLITAAKMLAPAQRMETWHNLRGAPGMMGDQKPSGD